MSILQFAWHSVYLYNRPSDAALQQPGPANLNALLCVKLLPYTVQNRDGKLLRLSEFCAGATVQTLLFKEVYYVLLLYKLAHSTKLPGTNFNFNDL